MTQAPATTFAEHSRALRILGLPLIGSTLAQFAIHITDTMMLGWYGVDELAAVTVAGALYFLAFLVGTGFSYAVMSLVAEAEESGDAQGVRRATRMGLWLSALYGAVLLVPMLFAETILLAIRQEPHIAALGGQYLTIAAWALAGSLIINVFRSYLSALELVRVLLWITIGTAILNAAANYALIFGNFGAPEMGIRGAAVASLVTVTGGLVAFVVYIAISVPQHRLFQRLWRPDWSALWTVFRLGVPIGLTALAEGGLFTMSSIMMGWVGAIELAAHGAAIMLASIVFVVHSALSQAATVRAGRALARKDGPGLRLGAKVAFVWSMAFVGATIVVFVLVPDTLISIFVDRQEPRRDEVIAVGAVFILLAAVFQLFDALQVMALGVLRGVQDTATPFVLAVISYWAVGIPVCYLLTFTLGWGGPGIWAGLSVGLALASVLLCHRFWTRSGWIEGPA